MVSSMADHKRANDHDTGLNTRRHGPSSRRTPVTLRPSLPSMGENFPCPPSSAGEREGCPSRAAFYFRPDAHPDGPEGHREYNPPLPWDSGGAALSGKRPAQGRSDRLHRGTLADTEVKFSDGAAACVIIASGGCPVAYEKAPIIGLVDGQLPDEPNVTVYHSGTAITEDGQLVTNGGRVLGVTATAPGLPRAISIAYEAAEHIHFDKLHKRTDIGMRALKALAEKE